MNKQQAREWVRDNARPCPNCGSAVLVSVEGDKSAADFMQALGNIGAVLRIVPTEEVEEDIVASGFDPTHPKSGVAGGEIR